MLHNTGQYGQSDVPLNVSQANIMSGRVNIGNNINNLDKMPQHPPPPVNSHFNLPEYNPYALNMNPGLSQFQNFHPVGFPQNHIQNWQNNAIPMNLNMHSQQSYMYGKPETDYKDQSCSKNMLNVPQVHTKAFHKQMGMDMDNYQNLSTHFRHYTDYNPDLSMKPHKADSDIRHIEQNHRMEDRIMHPSWNMEQNLDLSKHKMTNSYSKPATIYQHSELSITANKEDNQGSMSNHMDLSLKSQKMEEKRYQETIMTDSIKPTESLSYPETQLDLSRPQKLESTFPYNADINNRYYKDSRRRSLENTVKMIENIISHNQKNQSEAYHNSNNETIRENVPIADVMDNATDNNKPADDQANTFENIQNENRDKPDDNQNEDNTNNDSENNESSDESSSEEDVKPNISKLQDIPIDESVEIKIEVVPSIIDMEHLNPFHRDMHGVRGEDVGDTDIVDAEKSVNLAKEIISNNIQVQAAYFECPHCTLYFDNPKRFLVHTKWHTFGLTNEKRLELQKEKEIQRHMKKEQRVMERMNQNEVTDINAPGRKFSCKECDKVFTAKAALKNHKTRYHPKTNTTNAPRDCKICGKTTAGWHALRAHMRSHSSESGYQCADCPKRFKHPHSLAKHRDTHLEKTHECQQCPKKFGSAALLNVHMKTHERFLRGATFRCTYCAKGFFESYSLQVHERTHRNERPYLCEICNTSFGTNSSLKRHIKVSHSTSKPFECSICHRCFISEAIRERHVSRSHGNPEDFKFMCKQCPCKYLKLKDLKKHMYKIHPKGKRKKKVHSDSE